MFPMAFMDKLGISTSDCQTVSGRGAGGAGDFLFWPDGVIKARLSRWNLELSAFFGSPAIPLLGRADFFALFRCITFDEQSKTFTIEK